MPDLPGWDTYIYIFTGESETNCTRFAEAESGLVTKAGGFALRAVRPSLVLAFLINPDAQVTREGTVGH